MGIRRNRGNGMLTCLGIGCLGIIVLVFIGLMVIGWLFADEEMVVVKETAVVADGCYQGEVFNEEEQICILDIPCKDAITCGRWGDELLANLERTYGPLDDFTYADDTVIDEQIVASYDIYNNVVQDEVSADYLWQWQAFEWMTPDDYTTMIDFVEIFEGNETNAYVKVADGEYATIGLNAEPFIASETIQNNVHELAHLFSLRPDQVDYSIDESACKTLYTEEEGCFYKDSYMYQFYTQFWLPSTSKETDINFLNDYAMTHEQEDFAESFTYFVLYPKPAGQQIVNQKLLFFYQYEEMVNLRTALLARIATWLPRVSE